MGLLTEECSTSWTASWKDPGYCELVIEVIDNFVFDQLLVVWSPRKRVDEVISIFPLGFLPLPMFTLAMLNNSSCVVTFVRVELLTSFPESTKKTAILLVDEPVVVCLFPATPKAVVASNLHLKSQV